MADINFEFLKKAFESGNLKIERRFDNCVPVSAAQYKSIWLCDSCYKKLGREYECFTDSPLLFCEICNGKPEHHICSLSVELIEQLAYGVI